MDRAFAESLLARLHSAQNEYYAGGGSEGVRALLTEDVVWTVPGVNAIAGVYRGIEAVLVYFDRRRTLARGTFRMHRLDVLTGDGDMVAALTDGTAMVGGLERRWSTVGLYGVRGNRIAACWLVPLDAAVFDEVWAG